MSLPKGGFFDLNADWNDETTSTSTNPHQSHRFGLDADINVGHSYCGWDFDLQSAVGYFLNVPPGSSADSALYCEECVDRTGTVISECRKHINLDAPNNLGLGL